MTLLEQAARRVELARAVGVEPLRWVASAEVAGLADAGGWPRWHAETTEAPA